MSDVRELIRRAATGDGDYLELMMRMQLEAQLHLAAEKGGGDPAELRSPQYTLMHVSAAKAELQELLDETGWKAWSKDQNFVNIEEARGEWIDVWHFMMNLALMLEMTPDMILQMYTEKLKRNVDRWDNDYDAREGKCFGCGRDFSDLAAHGWSDLQLYQVPVSDPAKKGHDIDFTVRQFHSYECYEEHKND